MIPQSILSNHDWQEHPDCYHSDEPTEVEKLRYVVEQACKAAETQIDSEECEVKSDSNGDCRLTLSLYPVTYETRKAAADALVYFAAIFLKEK